MKKCLFALLIIIGTCNIYADGLMMGFGTNGPTMRYRFNSLFSMQYSMYFDKVNLVIDEENRHNIDIHGYHIIKPLIFTIGEIKDCLVNLSFEIGGADAGSYLQFNGPEIEIPIKQFEIVFIAKIISVNYTPYNRGVTLSSVFDAPNVIIMKEFK